MNQKLIIGIVAIIIVAAGVGIYSSNSSKTELMKKEAMMQKEKEAMVAKENSAMEQQKEKDAVMMAKDIVVPMNGENGSGQTGKATLIDMDGKTKVVIDIPSNNTGVSQPAHIHVGACPAVGAVKYPLSNVVNGKSETVLAVSLATLAKELPLAINVHKSKEEAKVFTSCGDLPKEILGAMMMEKKDGAMMDGANAMMAKYGSYEMYSPEKIALAAAKGDVVLDFYAGWCPVCRSIRADILANMKDIPANLTILEVDYDNSADLKKKYGVMLQSTMVQVDKDGKMIKKWNMMNSTPTLATFLSELKK